MWWRCLQETRIGIREPKTVIECKNTETRLIQNGRFRTFSPSNAKLAVKPLWTLTDALPCAVADVMLDFVLGVASPVRIKQLRMIM